MLISRLVYVLNVMRPVLHVPEELLPTVRHALKAISSEIPNTVVSNAMRNAPLVPSKHIKIVLPVVMVTSYLEPPVNPTVLSTSSVKTLPVNHVWRDVTLVMMQLHASIVNKVTMQLAEFVFNAQQNVCSAGVTNVISVRMNG